MAAEQEGAQRLYEGRKEGAHGQREADHHRRFDDVTMGDAGQRLGSLALEKRDL